MQSKSIGEGKKVQRYSNLEGNERIRSLLHQLQLYPSMNSFVHNFSLPKFRKSSSRRRWPLVGYFFEIIRQKFSNIIYNLCHANIFSSINSNNKNTNAPFRREEAKWNCKLIYFPRNQRRKLHTIFIAKIICIQILYNFIFLTPIQVKHVKLAGKL